MAKIIAGVATSHVPAIGAALDNGRAGEPYWKPVLAGYERSKEWIAKVKPDVCIIVFNDHASNFSLEMFPTFAIGTGEDYAIADEGWGPRPVPPVKGHPDLAWHMVQSVVQDDFDLCVINKMAVDHGLTVPLSLMFGQPKEWPCPIIPVLVNVVVYPVPTGRRCFMLGKAIRKAVESFDKDLKIVIFGTGGMSHQLAGRRAGLINKEFDNRLLDNLVKNPAANVAITHLEYLRESGSEGIEMVMWQVMRGALDDDVNEIHRFYHVPASNTAVGHIILENKQ